MNKLLEYLQDNKKPIHLTDIKAVLCVFALQFGVSTSGNSFISFIGECLGKLTNSNKQNLLEKLGFSQQIYSPDQIHQTTKLNIGVKQRQLHQAFKELEGDLKIKYPGLIEKLKDIADTKASYNSVNRQTPLQKTSLCAAYFSIHRL